MLIWLFGHLLNTCANEILNCKILDKRPNRQIKDARTSFIFNCWGCALLRILRGSGMIDMNVSDGWHIHIAVAHC